VPRESERFQRFLRDESARIGRLAGSGITLVGSFPEGGILTDPALFSINGAALEGGGLDLVVLAFRLDAFDGFAGPAVIDVEKAAIAFGALGNRRDAAAVRAALLRGRLRLQGTDGVRGPVSLTSEGNSVLSFGRTGEITPELVEVLCYSFGRMARREGVARQAGKVIVAEDGRDAATGGRFASAMRDGLREAGLRVVSLGTAPTPAVPFACAYTGARLGAALTASHNPASHNGIKFFVDGSKVLPEGPLGDFALSALAYMTAYEGRLIDEGGTVEDGGELVEMFAEFIVKNLPPGARDDLAKADIVFDGANGAATDAGRMVFEKLKIPVTSVNDKPSGGNINQGGGVAELEGARVITAADAAGSPQFAPVKAVLERAGRIGRAVYGIVLDGDGDRGFVVVADGPDKALVVAGDACAYVLARHWRRIGMIPDAEASHSVFVGTVESDLEVFKGVKADLGLEVSISCVGDKWLAGAAREGKRLAIGEEVSGHVLWPAPVVDERGVTRYVSAGNGLLTALSVISAGIADGLSPLELARPFPEGVFVTRYTYNVSKALFFPGSAAWEADLRAVAETLDAARGSGFASWRVIEHPDEPDMLYVALEDDSRLLSGAVFVRNSGTENKTGVYARGAKALEPLLADLCLLLWKTHRETLKDRHSPGYRIEAAVLRLLGGGPLTQEELVAKALACAPDASPDAVSAAIYGMRKEGLVSFSRGMMERSA
jgi:phosphoglucosamine mutase